MSNHIHIEQVVDNNGNRIRRGDRIHRCLSGIVQWDTVLDIAFFDSHGHTWKAFKVSGSQAWVSVEGWEKV